MESHLYMLIRRYLQYNIVKKDIVKTKQSVSDNQGMVMNMPKELKIVIAYIFDIQYDVLYAGKLIIIRTEMFRRKPNLRNRRKKYKQENLNFGKRKTKFQSISLKKLILIFGK